MNFFDLIMSPFVYVIKQIFLLSFQLTGNYGVAIILLSLAISLILLPVFILIEKAKKTDDVVKQKMKPLIDEIKRVYKGQERYYYIKTINRQHNYSSLKSLIPILSLLLQIPFFIAAYQFLEYYEPLKGVSFSFVKDLSQADGLLGIINVLPILMTIVNLITVYFYTRYGNGERKQMLILALAFLVLLFNLPAGLVLYWTMNNVFSFFRLLITNPEVFKNRSYKVDLSGFFSELKISLPILKKVFFISLLLLLIIQLRWALNYNFDDFPFRVFAAIGASLGLTIVAYFLILIKKNVQLNLSNLTFSSSLFFSLLALVVYFSLAGHYYFNQENPELYLIGIILLLFLQIGSGIYVYVNRKNISLFVLIILSVLASSELINCYRFFIEESFQFSFFGLKVSGKGINYQHVINAGLAFVSIVGFYYLKNQKNKLPKIKGNAYVYFLSVLYLTGFVFLWNPLIVYSSFPENYIFPAIDILKNNFYLFFLSTLILGLIYFVTPKNFKGILMLILLFVSLISLIYNSIIPIDMGSLQETKYLLQSNLEQPISMYLLESFLLLAIFFLVRFIVKKKYFKTILVALVLLNSTVIIQSFVLVLKTGSFLETPSISTKFNNSSISFSKTKENVVFVVADMFYGWHMDKILKEEKEITDDLSGFVWYPNTLSISSITCASLPPIIGGYDFTVDEMNKDKIHTTVEKMTDVTEQFVNKVKAKGFDMTSTDMVYSKIDKNKYDTYLPKWNSDWEIWNNKLSIGESVEEGHTLLWKNASFYCLPLFLKPKVYDNGRWLKNTKKLNQNTNSAKPYNFFRLLPFISDSKNEKPNFVYIHTMASHHPWDIIEDDGSFVKDVTPYENNKWFLQTFIKWTNWMKENDVYDNTKIVLLSDHGIHWRHVKGKIEDSLPIKNFESSNLNMEWVKELYPLLLVKDINKTGPLVLDQEFMSNADASYLAFGEEIPKVYHKDKRVLPSTVVYWRTNIGSFKQIDPEYKFEARGSAYDFNYWKVLTKKE